MKVPFVITFLAITVSLLTQTAILLAEIGRIGAIFLQENIAARSFGMGSAFTALSDDVTGLNFNPAGLHYVPYPELTILFKKGLLDTYYGYIGYLKPLKHKGTLGMSLMLFDGGNIELNYLDGRTEKVKMEQDIVATIGYGNSLLIVPLLGDTLLADLSEMIFFGANLKIINSTLGGKYTANAIASDFGVLFRTIDSRISIGMAIQNCGTGLKYKNVNESLPMNIRAGAAFVIQKWSENSLLFALDYIHTINESGKVHLGAELQLFKNFTIRAGYKIGYNPNKFTLGLGVFAYKTQVDYGYSIAEIDVPHRISITVKFGSREKKDIARMYKEKKMYGRAEYIRSLKK